MKELLEGLKELRQNRKKVGLYKAAFWLLFFIFLIIIYYIPTGTTTKKTYTNNKPEEKIEDDNKINNYSFEYKIDNTTYTGNVNDTNIELVSDECSFYITDDKTLMDKEACVLPDYTYLNMNTLDELLSRSELDSKKSYKDGKEEYEYTSNINDEIINIIYIKNTDDTIDADIKFSNKEIIVHYYNFNNTSISFDLEKYKYEYKEVENEY